MGKTSSDLNLQHVLQWQTEVKVNFNSPFWNCLWFQILIQKKSKVLLLLISLILWSFPEKWNETMVSEELDIVWLKVTYVVCFPFLGSNLPCFKLFPRQCPGLWSIDSCISPNSVSGLRRSDQPLHFSFEWLQQHTRCHHTLGFWLCLANLPPSGTPPCEKARTCQIYENLVFQRKLKSRGGVSQNRTQARTCRRFCFHPAGWFHHWNTEEWEVTGTVQVKELRQAGRWVWGRCNVCPHWHNIPV